MMDNELWTEEPRVGSQDDEILWQGSPALGPYIRQQLMRTIPKLLAMPALAFVATFGLGKAGLPHIDSSFALMMTGFAGAGVAIFIPIVIWAVLKEARETSYSISKRRALISVPTMNASMQYEVDLTSPPPISLVEFGGGVGTITFGEGPTAHRFRMIPDAREVYDLIQGKGVADEPAERASFPLPKGWLSNPLESYLQPGEKFLWLGKPQNRAYTKSTVLNAGKLVALALVPLAIISIVTHMPTLFFGIALWLGGMLCLVAFLASRNRVEIYYGLTNKRVLVREFVPAHPNQFTSIPLDQLQCKLGPESGGFGTIDFDAPMSSMTIVDPSRDRYGGLVMPGLSFRGIPDAQSVYDQILDAKRQLTSA